jgi:hypothetical protein
MDKVKRALDRGERHRTRSAATTVAPRHIERRAITVASCNTTEQTISKPEEST